MPRLKQDGHIKKEKYEYNGKAEPRFRVCFSYEKSNGTTETIKKMFRTKSEASDYLNQLRRDHTKKGDRIEHRNLTFQSYAADYKKNVLPNLKTEKGEAAKVDLMIEHFGDIKLDKLRRPEIKNFKTFLQETKHLRTKKVWNKKTKQHDIKDASKARCPRTVNSYLERLRNLLNEAETDEILLSAPSFKGIIDKDKEVKRNKIITYADFEKVLAACDVVRSNHDRKHIKLPLIALYEIGCRLGEMRKVKVKDIDLDSRIVMVWEGKRKNPKQIPCYITDRLHDAIIENGVMDKSANAQAFGGQTYFSRSFRTAKKIAGVDMDLKINDERHSNITYKNQSGMDLVAVQKGVGHSAKSAMTLDVYTNPQPDYIVESHQKFEAYSKEQRKQAEISALLARVEDKLISEASN